MSRYQARGHYCWVCQRHRANERFSGRGHRDHVCKECSGLLRRRARETRKARDLRRASQASTVEANGTSPQGAV